MHTAIKNVFLGCGCGFGMVFMFIVLSALVSSSMRSSGTHSQSESAQSPTATSTQHAAPDQTPARKPSEKIASDNNIHGAWVYAQLFVERELYAPKSASYQFGAASRGAVVALGDRTYLVASYVDADTRMGVKARSQFKLKLREDSGGKRWEILGPITFDVRDVCRDLNPSQPTPDERHETRDEATKPEQLRADTGATERPSKDEMDNMGDAWRHAKMFVARELVAPASAEFCFGANMKGQIMPLGSRKYGVDSSVVAQTTNGIKTTSDFSCAVQECESGDSWQLVEDITFSNHEICAKQDKPLTKKIAFVPYKISKDITKKKLQTLQKSSRVQEPNASLVWAKPRDRDTIRLKAKKQYIELMLFCHSEMFREWGFSVGGPFNKWQVETDDLRSIIPNSLMKDIQKVADGTMTERDAYLGVAAGKIAMLGREFLRTKGRDTNFTRQTVQEIEECLGMAQPEPPVSGAVPATNEGSKPDRE